MIDYINFSAKDYKKHGNAKFQKSIRSKRRYFRHQVFKLGLQSILDEMFTRKGFEWFPTDEQLYYICGYCNFSEDFIRKFKYQIDWYGLQQNTKIKLSDKFCEEFDEFIFALYHRNRFYYVNARLHRTLGPAATCNGVEEYWYRGQKAENVHSMEEYRRWLKLKLFF